MPDPNLILPGDTKTLGSSNIGESPIVHYQIGMPFSDAVARGEVSGFTALSKFGKKVDVGTSGPETLWPRSAAPLLYGYLSSAEQLQVASADVDDVGTVRAFGTADGGSTTTLEDTASGDFITDGVVAGDALVNDTNELYGIVLSTTATVITLNRAMSAANATGNTYRVIGADDTGAGLIVLEGLDASYVEKSEFVVLNGQTNVTTTASFLRVFRAFSIIAGSTGAAEGQITVNNNLDTVTLLLIDTEIGRTQMALWTVPAGKTFYMDHFWAWENNNKRARILIFRRQLGELFREQGPSISVNADSHAQELSPLLVFPEKTDIELRVWADSVNAHVGGGFEGWYG